MVFSSIVLFLITTVKCCSFYYLFISYAFFNLLRIGHEVQNLLQIIDDVKNPFFFKNLKYLTDACTIKYRVYKYKLNALL